MREIAWHRQTNIEEEKYQKIMGDSLAKTKIDKEKDRGRLLTKDRQIQKEKDRKTVGDSR